MRLVFIFFCLFSTFSSNAQCSDIIKLREEYILSQNNLESCIKLNNLSKYCNPKLEPVKYSYNIQFNNYSPILIDLMSIKKYSEGEFWVGHKQFCESFLNPLVLKSKLGVDYNNQERKIYTSLIFQCLAVFSVGYLFSEDINQGIVLLLVWAMIKYSKKLIKN